MAKVWIGCSLPGWWRLLAGHRFDVSPRFLPTVALTTLIAAYHTAVAGLQRGVFGRKIDAVELPRDPLFVLGHWRTGTTLMHTLLGLDPRFTYPTTSQCMNPAHLLMHTLFESRLTRRLTPLRRAPDNRPLSADSPQEDEFALCLLGVPSTVTKLAFPNRPFEHLESLDLDDVDSETLDRWKRVLTGFLKQVLLRRPGRPLLKSPQHTCRLKVLLDMFPEARFVYLVRSPYAVIPSTLHLWRVLWTQQGLQVPTFSGLEDLVFETFRHLHQRVEQTRHLAPDGRFHAVRFEDLTAAPLEQTRLLYERLALGSFEAVRPAVEQYLADLGDCRGRQWEIPAALRDRITRECGDYMQRHGYSPE